jgi:hypothetical protein
MPVDPNDMLIFKLRGMHFQAGGAQKIAAAKNEGRIVTKNVQAPSAYATVTKPQAPIETASVKPTIQAPVKQPQAKVQAQVEAQPEVKVQTEVKPEKINANVQAAAKESLHVNEEKAQNIQAAPEGKTQKKQYVEEEKRIVEEFINRQKMEEAESEAEITSMQKPKKRLTKTEKDSMESAKGLMCVNHPWRPAYAICDYCKRPFCYADLVEYNNKFYCLEDIDKVTKNPGGTGEAEMNPFILASGAIFIANAIILAYFVYPQIAYFTGQMAKIGLISFISTINYSYMLSLLNLIAVILGLSAGVVLFVKLDKNIYSIFMGAVMFIISSYVYLISNALYLLAVTVIAFIAIGSLAYGRIPSGISTEEKELRPTDIEWPRLESF